MSKYIPYKALLLSGIMLSFCNVNALAMEKEDIYDEMLSVYSDRDKYNNHLSGLLNSVNISNNEHQRILNSIKRYIGSDVEKWWLVESGRLIFDDVIFSIPDIKNIYLNKLQNYGQSSIYAYAEVKRGLIGNIENIDSIFNNSLTNHSDLESIFLKHFNRNPSPKELNWLRKNETIKYALYGGVLGREISIEEQSKITNEEGYKLLSISDKEKQTYEELITIHNKFEIQEVSYLRAYKYLDNIKNVILEFYDIDIFDLLTIKEREDICISSTKKYQFNERTALELTLNKLKEKGLIKDDIEDWPEDIIKPEIPSESPSTSTKPGINDDFTSGNVIGSLNNHIQNINKNNIYKALTSSISDLYKKLNTSNSNKNQIYFKYNNIEYRTGISLKDNGTITKVEADAILKLIAQRLGGKTVEAKYKTMILVNQSIGILKKPIDESKYINFQNLSYLSKSIGVEIYKKNANDSDKS